jgi:RNase P subunit RPR2
MPKIIKEGKLPKSKTHQVTCSNCTTLFEFEEREARTVSDGQHSVLVISCPLCGREIWHSK